MTENKQGKNNGRKREHVQRVLDCHNKKYGTHITIKGKTQDVHPDLKGKSDWDWVCHDTETSDEIAVEVKKITDEKLEVRYDTIWDILREIGGDLSNKLPGTFALQTNIPKNDYLSLRGQQKKQRFKDILCEAIFQTAQTLKLGDDRGLIPQISKRLPFALPDSFFCALQKVGDEGSMLQLGSTVGGFWSIELKEHELTKFEEMVSQANKQLKQASSANQTFLVIIEEGLRSTIPETVAMALEQINRNSYSHINHIYYVSGKKVVEIPLPIP